MVRMAVMQPVRKDQSDSIATHSPIADHRPRWLTWRVAVPLLTLLFVLYPAVMPIPRHELANAAATAQNVPAQTGVTESCPPIDLCVNPAVEQALPRLPATPLLLLAAVVLFLATRWQRQTSNLQRDWWWPPGPHRALLQVFLI